MSHCTSYKNTNQIAFTSIVLGLRWKSQRRIYKTPNISADNYVRCKFDGRTWHISVLFSLLFWATFTILHPSLSLLVPPSVGRQRLPPSLSVTWPWEAAAGSTVTLWWLCNYIPLHTHTHSLKCLLLLRTEKNSRLSQEYISPMGWCQFYWLSHRKHATVPLRFEGSSIIGP